MKRISKYDILYGIAKAVLILVGTMVLIYAIGWLWSGGRVDT